MGFLGFHHVGTFLLLVTVALLTVTTITAPVTTHLSIIDVTLYNNGSTQAQRTVTLGVLGNCLYSPSGSSTHDTTSPDCTKAHIGYNASIPLTALSPSDEPYGSISGGSLNKLTYALVLHPVAGATMLVAFVISALSHRFGYLFAAFLAAFGTLLTVIAFAVDAIMYGIVRVHVALHEEQVVGTVTKVTWGLGLKLAASAIATGVLAVVLTAFSCFADRRRQKEQGKKSTGAGVVYHELGVPVGGKYAAY
ncbi:pali-domain-containing protein [Meredithblackwellia eburnea MCA 4105]